MIGYNMIPLCSIWSTENVQWNNANWTWAECQMVQEIILGNQPGVDAEILIQPWQLEEPWNPYKKMSSDKRKRLIRLICKVRGEEYSEEKETQDFSVKIGDIKTVVKAVANVDLDFRLEE